MVITVDGRPVARLATVDRRPRFIGREEFVRRLLGQQGQADSGLRVDLDELAGDMTEDLPPL
ncbi:hypothetical protein FDG2_4326 [Candidatus Protofrankia californiensis]|uniref:Uncharacterized protein n=2 Tax=Protofrankia TaxID=2994361 RepID=A0A1C3P4U7_9ACTN|nr:hypothetical protein FDG2_4326 [Candidatus Protofrankia californiensis]